MLGGMSRTAVIGNLGSIICVFKIIASIKSRNMLLAIPI